MQNINEKFKMISSLVNNDVKHIDNHLLKLNLMKYQITTGVKIASDIIKFCKENSLEIKDLYVDGMWYFDPIKLIFPYTEEAFEKLKKYITQYTEPKNKILRIIRIKLSGLIEIRIKYREIKNS